MSLGVDFGVDMCFKAEMVAREVDDWVSVENNFVSEIEISFSESSIVDLVERNIDEVELRVSIVDLVVRNIDEVELRVSLDSEADCTLV